MTDAFVIMQASRLGYEIMSDSDNRAWYRKDGKTVGPYKTLEDASYAAIEDYELKQYEDWPDED
jgi:hypothetical protein